MKPQDLRIGNYINRPDLGDGHLKTGLRFREATERHSTGKRTIQIASQNQTPKTKDERWIGVQTQSRLGC